MEQKGDTNGYLWDYRRLTAEILDVKAPKSTFEQRLETYLLISCYAGKVSYICSYQILFFFGITGYVAGWIQSTDPEYVGESETTYQKLNT